jgi:transcriptional regulator with XRE-family HTH domain
MIRSESEYREAVLQATKSFDRLNQYRSELECKGYSPDEVENALGPMLSLRADSLEEIRRYERIRSGDLSSFRSLRSIGQLLIAARIAAGLSQRQLANRLGNHESQVSRDEKNEYQGISIERASQILDALSVEVRLEVSLSSLVAGIGAELSGGSHQFDFDLADSGSPSYRDVLLEGAPPRPSRPRRRAA